jgi:hypothetical protein
MANYDVITDTNSYHGIKTTYGMPGMPKQECDKCIKKWECSKLPAWTKLCEIAEEHNKMAEIIETQNMLKSIQIGEEDGC